ncbi:hypothetical protein VNO80_29768 [Phaseolus coccineus]|uniref:Uncharacterized protein n=1 Tax=Phaseolus coccineus TaxID=3886 RepID=A0AAN9LGJ9_PHACN
MPSPLFPTFLPPTILSFHRLNLHQFEKDFWWWWRVNVISRKSIDEHVRIKIHWGHVKFEGQIYASMTVITSRSPHTNNATKNMQLSPRYISAPLHELFHGMSLTTHHPLLATSFPVLIIGGYVLLEKQGTCNISQASPSS